MDAIFNSDGTLSRQRKTACKQCGEMRTCDDCWEHTSDWSPFGVWTCLLCQMPQALYCEEGAGVDPVRCEFCGWDEATECTDIIFVPATALWFWDWHQPTTPGDWCIKVLR